MTTVTVSLAIYDLSRGMARTLSAQFLGGQQYAIDAIPHTGVVVYGREYFFGAGIASEDPLEFRRNTGMFPMQIISLGSTTVTRAQFEQWCQQVTRNGRYSPNAYDLLNRNCNHFAHEAALEGLRCSQGVPEWILDVPRRFLSSPMGQMVRPMLQNMQVTTVQGAQPVSAANAPLFSVPTPTTTTTPLLNTNSTASSSTAIPSNPWANLTPSSASTAGVGADRALSVATNKALSTPKLDSFHQPLLSKDHQTVALCLQKIQSSLSDLNETDQSIMKAAQKEFSEASHQIKLETAEPLCALILRACTTSPAVVTFALMLLRLIVLSKPESTLSCLDWTLDQLIESSASTSPDAKTLLSPAARSVAWMVMSNAVAVTSQNHALPLFNPDDGVRSVSLVEAALADISPERQARSEIRQAACAYLYNWVLISGRYPATDASDTKQGDGTTLPESVGESSADWEDTRVSILCACLEGLDVETDETAKLRRIMVLGRILQPRPGGPIHVAAQSLIQELGYVDMLSQQTQIAREALASPGGSVAKKDLPIALSELLSLLEAE